MKNLFTSLLILLALDGTLFSQSKPFDIVTFTAPKGWARSDKPGSRTYTVLDQSNSVYGLVAIYASVPSSGDPVKDFTRTWDTMVKQYFGAGIAPAPMRALPQEGYIGYKGTSIGKSGGKPTTVTLVNYTGGGKTLSIVLNYNDNKYELVLEKFLQSIKLEPVATGK